MLQPDVIENIFLAALDRTTPEDRAAFVEAACAGDSDALHRVCKLLAAHDQSRGPLDAPLAAGPTIDLPPPGERPGTMVGPYKLLQQIGEGGMGTVYMAEQTEPVKRKVALKVIKAGMDSRQVIARFEAERQALAIMDHPNIAKVFDGGATDSGRPYFVMELVKGVPITEFCDEQKLTPRQRLELFVPVCQAVQHAHQKGIIHRDLKPSNVLVSRHDTTPIVKVIDFGVSKALGQALTDKTLFTGIAQMIGTPLYMSPEQAGMSDLDVDTRSDIYSLGVLLYELLTGTTPFEKERFKQAAYDEIRRIIREEEPPKPSTRLSDSTNSLPSISAQRHMEPAKLTKLVRGELDWIVMKALEKDRSRRYETANGFAADIQRYLADEPVQACPPTAGYRLRKFARRNKGGLSVAALVLFFVVLLGSGAGWMMRDRSAREAEAARQQVERQAKVAGQVESIFAEVGRLEEEQKWPEALAAARRAEAIVAGGEADAATAERVRERLRDLEFVDRLEQIFMRWAVPLEREIGDQAHLDREYARAFREYGADFESLPIEQSIDRLKARPALSMALAAALQDWANARVETTSDKFSNAFSKRLIAIARGIDPEPLRDWLRLNWGKSVSPVELGRVVEALDMPAHRPATLRIFANWLDAKDRNAAIKLARDAQRVHPRDFWLAFNLANWLRVQKDFEGAARFYTAAISIRPQAIPALVNLGLALRNQKKLDEAVATYRRALDIDPKFAEIHNHLGGVLMDQNKLDEAVAAYRKAIELEPKKASFYSNLGNVLVHQKKLDEAVAACRRAIELDPKFSGAYSNLGVALNAQKKRDEAVAACRKAIELDPKNSRAYSGLGIALYKLKRLDEAVAAYRKAIELDPEEALPYNNLGSVLRDQNKLVEAAAACRKAIELDPKNAIAYGNLGHTLAMQKKPDEAVAAFRKAIELDKDFANAHSSLGVAFVRQKKLDKALAAFRKAIELDPKNALYHYNLGKFLCDELAEYDKAIESYRTAIQLDPQDGPAHGNLAQLLATCADARLRDPARAVSLAKKAIELTPAADVSVQAHHWQTLGWALYRTGDWKGSIAALEKSMALQPSPKGGDSGQWFPLAMAHWQLGEKEKAREWYDRAVEWMDKNTPADKGFVRFSAEAAELLGVKNKKD